MKQNLTIAASSLLMLLAACSKSGNSGTADVISDNPATIAQTEGASTINLTAAKQTIRGFGGSSAWNGQLTDADCDKLFTTIGLSLLRVRIDPGKNWTDEIANAKKAVARGATVFASPWSPPANMKDNNNTIAGTLLTTQYGNYATWLNSFVSTMLSNGVPLYAVSIQNEPNINVSYESCNWTSTQMLNFMKNNAGAIKTKVMMPETFDYNTGFGDPILNNSTAAANTDICIYHWYGSHVFQPWTNANNKGKEVWMTEHFNNDQSLDASLVTATDIHNFMTVSNNNAYVWWWVKNKDCNLITDAGINKRGYVMGQFAKFVRPGYHRVNVSGGTNISAYTNGSKAVVVAINTSSSIVSQQFFFQNGTVNSVAPFVTSASKNLQAGAAVTVSGGTFTFKLEPKSVTTFVQR